MRCVGLGPRECKVIGLKGCMWGLGLLTAIAIAVFTREY